MHWRFGCVKVRLRGDVYVLRYSWYFRRPLGELRSAAVGDLGGQDVDITEDSCCHSEEKPDASSAMCVRSQLHCLLEEVFLLPQ